MVVVSHSSNVANLWGHLLGDGAGQIGVMVFFVLSGYLIGSLYLDRPFNSAAVLDYAVHRVARVVPMYYVVVTAAVLFGIYTINTFKLALLHYGFLTGVSVLWTVPVELQFYVMFIGLWWLNQRSSSAFIVVSVLVVVVYWLLPIHPSNDFRISPYYTVFFLSGLLVSRALRMDSGIRPPPWSWLLAPLATLPFLLYPNIYTALFGEDVSVWGSHFQEMWHNPYYALAASGLLVAALLSRPIIWLLASTPMRFIGMISYSMYLLHYPVIVLLQGIGLLNAPPLVFVATTLALSAAISTVTYLLIERPARSVINRVGMQWASDRQTPEAMTPSESLRRS